MAVYNISKHVLSKLNTGSSVTKSRVNSILEPFQCMIQLALLSTCPVKTKLSIMNNILYIQEPFISQGFQRWFQQDTKTDLLHLFTACQYFSVIYKDKLVAIKHKTTNLYELIISMAMKGLDKLISTYSMDNGNHIPQLLDIYKNILTSQIEVSNSNLATVYTKLAELYTTDELYSHFFLLRMIKKNQQKYLIIAINSINKQKYIDIANCICKHMNS